MNGKRIALIVVCIIAAGLGVWAGYNSSAGEFTKAKWDAASWQERQDMLDDLLDEYDFIGMTEAEVVEILGEETSKALGGEYSIRGDSEDKLVYDFGEATSAKSSNIQLVLTLGEDGRVVDVAVEKYSQ